MEESTSKEKMLKKIRLALMNQSKEANKENVAVDYESNVYIKSEDDPEFEFAKNFTDNGGKFIFCIDESEIIENLQYLMQENKWEKLFCSEIGLASFLEQGKITYDNNFENPVDFPPAAVLSCEQLIASNGSILLSSYNTHTRRIANSFKVLIILAQTAQVSVYMKDALKLVKQKYTENLPGWISAITFRNEADFKQEIYVFMLDSGNNAS